MSIAEPHSHHPGEKLYPLIALAWAVFPAVILLNAASDFVVGARERQVADVVSASHPWDHGRFDYQFVVAGRTYAGSDSTVSQKLDLSSRVIVHFDPQNPERSALDSFSDRAWTAAAPGLLGLVATCAGLVALNRRRRTQPR